MTIHRAYAENGNHAGFWVQHRTWRNTCGRVESIAGQSEGALRANEESNDVLMHLFDIRSGRRLPSQQPRDYRDDRNYTRIAEPYWCHGLEEKRAHWRRNHDRAF